MLIRAFYISRSAGPQTSTITGSILKTALVFNKINQVTGVLCQGKGFFLQILEGERSVVNQLYGRITRDTRHKDVEMISLQEISARQFGIWSMALIDLDESDPMVALQHPEFDPYSASSEMLTLLIDEWVRSGKPIQQ
ncbi:MAG: BLUF domain-containing protein [Limnohabitans sp.]